MERLSSQFYAEIQTPDLKFLVGGAWLRKVLADARHYNPLTWALAFAFCGSVERTVLDGEYQDAEQRKPQRDLFNHLKGPLRIHAPDHLYAAFTGVRYKQEAIANSGLERFEVDAWLRRDRGLSRHWAKTRSAFRRQEALGELAAFRASNPAARRVDYLRHCTAAYRWLDEADPDALQEMLPSADPRFGRQLAFVW